MLALNPLIRTIVSFAFAFVPLLAIAQSGQIGLFDGKSDIGPTSHPGSLKYDADRKTYTIQAAGDNMWMRSDDFFFVWKKVSGDLSIEADVQFPHPGKNPHRKAVLLFRKSLEADSVYADAALHGSGLTALQYRPAAGEVTGDVELNFDSISNAPTSFRIEKHGHYVSMYIGKRGEALRPSGATARLSLDEIFYVGIGVCSHDKEQVEEAVFSDVKLQSISEQAVAEPEIRSTLETISTDSTARRATEIYTTQGIFEAPNWSRDGKSLLFNQAGRIMTISAAGDPNAQPTPIDTGSITHCNGSHGPSPDGKWLAISCNPDPNTASRVYIVPLAGGTPRLVTQTPSSYFHSWSPDSKTIAFTRPHDGGGDIFSISVNGGTEARLTTTKGISDDPDYSPNGQFIYYNSDRGGGTMQIWRMRTDGSDPEQLTSDEKNNWTPHVSPDGKAIVFLSYDHSVSGHPTNKDVSLRLMSLGDRKIRVLVDLLGGSGTINVPSWAPDSNHLAFVSYAVAP